MNAADLMTRDVVWIGPTMPVREIAALLLKHRISAVPVLDAEHRVIGIVSEGDLLRHPRSTQNLGAWWLILLSGGPPSLEEIVRSRDLRAEEVMRKEVVAVGETAPADIIAGLLKRYRIKRLPVVREGKLVGIVSRADLLEGLLQGGRHVAEGVNERQ
jgi:CBS domain-containing protein